MLEKQISNFSYVDEFLSDLQVADKAKLTIKCYKKFLYYFFTEVPIPISEITFEDVLTWQELYQVDKAKKTVIQRLAILSSFFDFCVFEGYMEKNLVKPWWHPKKPNLLPRCLKFKDHMRLKVAAEELSLRDRAIFAIIDDTGIRRSEVSRLDVKDIDLDSRTAKVIAKGNKPHPVHFSKPCAYILKRYLVNSGINDGPLFRNQRGDRLSDRAIYNVINNIGKRAKLKRRLGPHILRHTFGTEMLANGASLAEVASALGHNSPQTTRIYARIPSEMLALKYRRCMG